MKVNFNVHAVSFRCAPGSIRGTFTVTVQSPEVAQRPRVDASPRVIHPDEAEQRVLRQLVEALLFEGLVKFDWQPRRHIAHDEVFDQEFRFGPGPREYLCWGTTSAFGRIRIAQGSIQKLVHGEPRPCGVIDLVASLGLNQRTQERLVSELEQTVDLCRWNDIHLPHRASPRRNLDFLQLESAIVEGHPYHPSFKARTGFSLRDHEMYGPEAGREFQLEWVAVARSSLAATLPTQDAAFWLDELGEETWACLDGRLRSAGGDWGDYGVLPAHPWQLRALLENRLAPAVRRKEVIPLGRAGDHYQATQSLRTLVNTSEPTRPNVKLPLDVVCTSARRNFETHFVCTAPAVSQWLAGLVASDPWLQRADSVLVLQEYAAMLYEPNVEPDAPPLFGQLGAIYRQSLVGHLRPGEEAVPFTALMLVESDRSPFVAPWLRTHGVVPWLDRLLEVVLLPLWHLLVHHGIALEAHAQNLVLIHRNGWPTRIALRDFHEDTEYVDDFLGRPDLRPRFEETDPYFATVPDDEGYRMADVEALRELFMDTVYVFNLADLSFLLERFGYLPESDFWNTVRARLTSYAESGVTDRTRIERVGCDAPQIIVESLLTKKILDGGTLDYFEHRVDNTLRG